MSSHRNPNPGSPENQFKEEFYRRIAFANQHFATASGRPGLRTDRGHMWIVYGPPDEWDSHPAAKPYPFEVWKYRYAEGLGLNAVVTFTDRTGKGEYNLASPPWKSPPKKNSMFP